MEAIAEETAIVNLAEPTFDISLDQYVAWTLIGTPVYGNTWSECFAKLVGANECAIDHVVHDDPMDLICELGPCAKCGPLTQGKCDWEGFTDEG